MTQRSAAEALGVSYVHLSNVERGKTQPSTSLVDRFRQVFGADIHVLAWCLFEEESAVPELLRVHHRQLADAWRQILTQSPA